MMADDAQLLAYVDGDLAPDERAAIEARLAESAETRKKLALLRASKVDYADAFARQPLPPVPESLRLGVEQLVRAHRSGGANEPAMPAGEQAPAHPAPSMDSPGAPPVRSRLRGVPVWLAAACVAGAFVVGQFVHFGTLFAPVRPGAGGAQSASAAVSPWVAAAVGYQKLYTRDTVGYRQDDPALAAKVVDDIRRDDRLALRVPDLSSAGLSFKSVQRLRFNNKPLVQIVYLPQKGPPIALCVMKDARPDETVASRKLDAMDVATWRQGELSYALIGQSDGVDLGALGKRIADSDLAPLFGQASTVADELAG
jgi:anti-sigma factor RsiW